MPFLNSFVQYVVVFVILAAVAGVGIFLGKKLSDRKNAKNSTDEK